MTTLQVARLMVCPPGRLPELFRLRCTVWLGEGADPAAFPHGEWRDERDALRQHWIALANDRVVATASLSIHSSLTEVEESDVYLRVGVTATGLVAAPSRLTVAREYRGLGLAQGLLRLQDLAAREARAVLAVRQASSSLKPLLRRRGWREHGPAPLDLRFPRTQFTVMSLLL